MQKRSIFLIWLVVFFPLNNMSTYGNTNVNNTAATDCVPVTKNDLFDIVEPVTSTDNSTNALQEFLSCFSVVSDDAMKYALAGYAQLNNEGKINKKDIITILDFSKPSTEERLFVINLKTKKLIAKSLCAHGRNSGEIWATNFSNNSESYQSSLGFYIANETYGGSNGFSLKLDGQEPGINDKARDRGVVIHGADYVSKDFINNNGKLGRSQGCPALPMEKNEKIINLIKGGSCFFIYHPNKNYKKQSTILKNYNETCLVDVVADLGE
jgi:hypothetical protein